MRNTPIKYHDGIGYDINGRSLLVMEGSSSSTLKEYVDPTQDDTIKTFYASIEILTSFLRHHATASFSSLCSVVSYSLQCVCTFWLHFDYMFDHMFDPQQLLFPQQPWALIMLATISKRKGDLWIFLLPFTTAIYGCKSLNLPPIFSLLFGSKKLS